MHIQIELDNVSKYHKHPGSGVRTPVLSGINMSVEKGETVAVVGPSGSGKSTLLNLMGALDQPSSGKVKLNGFHSCEIDQGLAKMFRKNTVNSSF